MSELTTEEIQRVIDRAQARLDRYGGDLDLVGSDLLLIIRELLARVKRLEGAKPKVRPPMSPEAEKFWEGRKHDEY